MRGDQEPGAYLDEARAAAQDAGRKILDVYERSIEVSEKEDGSPVTEADHAAHEEIVARLKYLTPDLPVLSEEAGVPDWETRSKWGRFWLVDPLDGTKEFVSKNGEFTVNIALIAQGEPLLGVVYTPARGIAYFGSRGGGSFKQEGNCAPEPIAASRYVGGKPRVVASRSHGTEALALYLADLGEHSVLSLGSSLKFCLVAEGLADVYPRLGPTMEWDTAAAQAVVEAAGGRVLDAERKPLRYNKQSLRNPWFVVVGDPSHDWARYFPKRS